MRLLTNIIDRRPKLLLFGFAALVVVSFLVAARGAAESGSVSEPSANQMVEHVTAGPKESEQQTAHDDQAQAASENDVISVDPDDINVNVHSETSTSSQGGNSASTSLKVNGQNVPVDSSGNVHQTIRSEDGNTTIDISIQNSSSTGGGGDM